MMVKRTFLLEDFELSPNVSNHVKSPDDDVTWFQPVVYSQYYSRDKKSCSKYCPGLKFRFPIRGALGDTCSWKGQLGETRNWKILSWTVRQEIEKNEVRKYVEVGKLPPKLGYSD